jgi:hypothetical protein
MGLEPITTRILSVITCSDDFNLLQNLKSTLINKTQEKRSHLEKLFSLHDSIKMQYDFALIFKYKMKVMNYINFKLCHKY